MAGLGYVYGGYGLLLHGLAWLTGRRVPEPPGYADAEWPTITVFCSALNEGDKIAARIANMAEIDYPRDRLEFIVVSDGSTDDTVAAAEAGAAEWPDLNVRVIALPRNQGRHAAQNRVAREGMGTILVTTDADSRFAPDFLRKLVVRFSEPGVGVVGGEKHYPPAGSSVAKSIGVYQRIEYWTRRGEDRHGLMAKTDGPCTGYLRELWDEHEEFEDVDHSIVALAWKAGYRARHAWDAVCYELPSDSVRTELRARSRMTRKGILTIRKRWPARMVFRHPGQTAALFSHRYVRYLSPLFVLCTVTGLVNSAAIRWGAAGAIGMFLLMVLGGLVPSFVPVLGRVAGYYRSFAVANYGFLLGILGFLRGDRRGRYAPTHPNPT